MKPVILYIDDEIDNLRVFQAAFRHEFNVMVASSAKQGLQLMRQVEIPVVIADYKMPETDGIDFFKEILVTFPDVTRIILTAHSDRSIILKSINDAKIHSFMLKPWNKEELEREICNGIEAYELRKKNVQLVDDLRKRNDELHEANTEIKSLKSKIETENLYLRKELGGNFDIDSMVGGDNSIAAVKNKIKQVAQLDTTVLITGETGTGKELVARSIHKLSNRKDAPFIKINCAAIQPTLIESELFGYDKGAFTGALNTKPGLFEVADEGTIFLDEIGETPFEFQSKLLRVLQDGEFYKVGGVKPIRVNVRVIAATNRKLEKEIEKGKFRADLYYRLNVFPIHVPPLRDRMSDIQELTRFFISKFEKKLGKTIDEIHDGIWKSLINHSWPGNIRELEGVIERSIITSEGGKLNLSDWISDNRGTMKITDDLPMREMEKRYILSILEKVDWKISGKGSASEILKLNHNTLRSTMTRLGIKFKNNSYHLVSENGTSGEEGIEMDHE